MWVVYVLLVATGRVLLAVIPGLSSELAWVLTHLAHAIVIIFHYFHFLHILQIIIITVYLKDKLLFISLPKRGTMGCGYVPERFL